MSFAYAIGDFEILSVVVSVLLTLFSLLLLLHTDIAHMDSIEENKQLKEVKTLLR